ncbi:hypothetical protein BH18THE1_BH18THE1_19510 [soil metagenome]
MSKVKEDKAPLQKIIQTMTRMSKIVSDEDGKAVKKDFLTYRRVGKNWLGNSETFIDYTEGIHYEPIFRRTTKLDLETGDRIINKEYEGLQRSIGY